MQIRLHGTTEECADAVERLSCALTVVAERGPCPDRAPSALVRVYLDVRMSTD